MNKKPIFEIDGFKVYDNSTYVIRDKEDYNAPSGFIKRGVTKLPSDGVGVTYQCGYVRKTPTSGVWDTGFWEYSPCYSNKNSEEVKLLVDNLKKSLVEPYERFSGKSGELVQTNDEFWTRKSFEVYTGKVYSTRDPEDRLALYFALKERRVTPKDKKGDATYKQSAYVILDINKDVKRKDEKSANLFKAIGSFEGLLQTDKNRLTGVLNYLNLVVASDIEDDSFRGIFKEWLEQKNGMNVELFLSLFNETKTEKGKAKVEIYIKLKQSLLKGNVVTKNPNGVLYYNEVEIGPDLKSAASNISKQKEFQTIKKELLFLDEDK